MREIKEYPEKIYLDIDKEQRCNTMEEALKIADIVLFFNEQVHYVELK